MKQIIMSSKWTGKSILFATIFLLSLTVFAQQRLPIIKAGSKKVDVQDGGIFRKGIWNLSPEVKPDIYFVIGHEKENKVTFYTDIDSITFIVKPGLKYDFIILLNGKDTCYTQILAPTPEKISYIKPKKIDQELLKQDFTVFRDSLQTLHAGLYRYKDKSEINELFDSCFATLKNGMTEIEYFRLISFLVSAIEDGHTECFLPSGVINYLKDSLKMFPMQLRFIDGKAYVPCQTKELPAGTELTSIDNKPINEIKEQLYRHLSSDGSNQTGKYAKINDGHDPFFYLYYVVFGEKPAFTVEYKTSTGKLETITLRADILKNIECPSNPAKIEKYLQLDYKSNNVAILTIKSFSEERLSGTKEEFNNFLQSSFKEIKDKKIKKLLIDLRDNGGGDDINGEMLYSYLTNKPFRYYASVSSNTEIFTADKHPNLAIQQPNENNFKGELYFLINGKSFSGTAEFSAIARSNGRGKFIGEETGGGYYGNTSGSRATIFLPNTKIRVNIPLNKYVMAVKKFKYKDRGIIPDYPIIPTINDILQNKDVQLNYALRLAEKN